MSTIEPVPVSSYCGCVIHYLRCKAWQDRLARDVRNPRGGRLAEWFKRHSRTLAQSTIHDATVTPGDVIAHLADFDADEPIYAESPPPRSSRDRKLAQNAEATRGGENPACRRASARRRST
jgi:hypothetical protein